MSQETDPNLKMPRLFLVVVGALVLVGAALLGRELVNRRVAPAATPAATAPAVAGERQPLQLIQAPTLLALTATPSPLPTATFMVVTPSPTPKDVFEAATRVAAATEQAREIGTATPLPPYMVTATPAPQRTLVTPTPTAANSATVEQRAALATAIAFTTGTPAPLPADVLIATLTATPVFVPLLEAPATPTPAPTAIFPAELVGKILFRSNMSGDAQPYAIDPDGAGLVRLTADWPISRAAAREARSNDNSYRARISRDLETGQWRLYYSAANSDELTLLTALGGLASPAWSPAGDQIAFVSTASGNEEIWLVDRAGGDPVQLTANSWPVDQRPTWSPDGQEIVFTSNRTGRRQLWIMNADGSDQRLLFESDYEAWDPLWVKHAE